MKNPASLGFIVSESPSSNPSKIVKIDGREIKVTLADTNEKRSKGLSGIEKLNEDSGMLFVFDSKDIYPSFWMKGMLIPIDIIWINDGVIVKIDENVAPPNKEIPEAKLPLYKSKSPIDYVLEVGAGVSSKMNFKVGSRVDL